MSTFQKLVTIIKKNYVHNKTPRIIICECHRTLKIKDIYQFYQLLCITAEVKPSEEKTYYYQASGKKTVRAIF
jgi:hypothetical protein